MSNVGEGVAEGAVVRWLKQAGGTVRADEPLVEVETDKAVVEMPSPFAGTLVRIFVAAGELVAIGAPLAEYEPAAAAGTAPAAAAAGAPSPAEPPTLVAPAAPAVEATLPPTRSQPALGAPPLTPVVLRLAAELGIDLAAVAADAGADLTL